MTKIIRSQIVVLFFFVFAIFSASGNENLEGKKELLDRQEVLARSVAATLEKYPDADTVLLGEATLITYTADAAHTQWQEAYLKILTEKGRQQNTTISSYYTIPYQLPEDCLVPLLEIIKADGSTLPIDVAAQSSTTILAGDMNINIYDPNNKVITVNIPNLEVGDVLHYLMYDHTRKPRAAGIFADLFIFERPYPVLYAAVEIHGVKDAPLKQIAVRNEISESIWATTATDAQGNPQYRWVVKDVPQIFPEPDMPPFAECAQRVLVSTAEKWEDVSAWYARLCIKPLEAISPEMRTEVSKVIGNETDPRKRAQLIFNWVSQQIRYMGVTTETEAPGYEPHPVNDTFTARHGVCRDKAALLAAMLRIAGIEAYPVLIHTSAKKDPQVPQPFFNHAITAAKIDGKYVLMDSTDETTRELLPEYLSDKSYIVAVETGGKLETSPVLPADKNVLTIDTVGTISAQGGLKAETVVKFEGINDALYRDYFARITANDRRRFFEDRVKSLYGDAQLTGFALTPENPRDTSVNLTARLQFEAKNIAARGKNITLLTPPFLGTRLGAVNFLLGKTGLEKRRFPLQFYSTCGVSESIKIDLPDEWDRDISMPVYKPIESSTLDWRRSLARVGKSLRGKSEFFVKTVEFSPDQYLRLKDALKTIEFNARKQPVFIQNSEQGEFDRDKQADSVLLNDDIEYEYVDQNSWRERRSVRRKILTYAGIKDESEIKIPYQPAVEKVILERAAVVSASGKVQMVSAHEINVMDQEWNGSAPRYPGGKILVVSLPGVEVNSTIEYRILREVKQQPFFYASNLFREFDPIVSRIVTLRAPESAAIAAFATLETREEETLDGARTWAIENSAQLRREEHLPPLGSFAPAFFASAGDWKNFAEQTRKRIIAAAENQPLARQKADLFTSGELTIAKVRGLVDHLESAVRRAGPEFADLPLELAITPADKTLSDAYGNSADLAVLYYAIFAPHQPELFLVSRYRAGENLSLPQTRLPNPQIFTHLLLRLTVAGRTVWLNDIDRYYELGTTPSDGMLALNLQTGEFETVKNDAHFQVADEINYAITMNNDGEAIIRKLAIITGSRYGAYKKMFAELRPEERRRYYQTELTGLSQNAVSGSDYITDFSAYPGRIEFTARVPKYAVEDDVFLYFSLPQTLRDLFGLRSARRHNPLFFAERKNVKITATITLPEKMRPMIMPTKTVWNSPVAGAGGIEIETFYSGSGAKDGNVLRIVQQADMRPAFYASALYPELIKVQAELMHANMRTILLAAKEWVEMQKIAIE